MEEKTTKPGKVGIEIGWREAGLFTEACGVDCLFPAFCFDHPMIVLLWYVCLSVCLSLQPVWCLVSAAVSVGGGGGGGVRSPKSGCHPLPASPHPSSPSSSTLPPAEYTQRTGSSVQIHTNTAGSQPPIGTALSCTSPWQPTGHSVRLAG